MAAAPIAPQGTPQQLAPVIQFPAKLQFLFRSKRYKVMRGGRGGAKSWGIARALLLLGTQSKMRILCAREYQKSITESVHHLLEEQIEILGLKGWYKVNETRITGRNGTEFIFAGLKQNINNLKSYEGVDIVWVEEAEKVSKVSWMKLIPTIRKAGSEIWVSYNPDDEKDPTHIRFGGPPETWPPNCEVVEINWWDNPWFPEELRKEMEHDYKVDPDTAAHVWEGKCNSRSDAQIMRGKWRVDYFEPEVHWYGPYFGMDFGFGSSAFACTKSWIDEHIEKRNGVDTKVRRLMIEHEFFGHGLSNKEINEGVRKIPGAGNHIIRGDCSRPETISALANEFGLHVIPCTKWTGCVEDGIQCFRSFDEIVIHPRCRSMQQEARLYKYKVDKISGDILPLIVDAWNHGWDGTRYAHEELILHFREEFIVIDAGAEVQQEVQISPELDQAEEPFFSTW